MCLTPLVKNVGSVIVIVAAFPPVECFNYFSCSLVWWVNECVKSLPSNCSRAHVLTYPLVYFLSLPKFLTVNIIILSHFSHHRCRPLQLSLAGTRQRLPRVGFPDGVASTWFVCCCCCCCVLPVVLFMPQTVLFASTETRINRTRNDSKPCQKSKRERAREAKDRARDFDGIYLLIAPPQPIFFIILGYSSASFCFLSPLSWVS